MSRLLFGVGLNISTIRAASRPRLANTPPLGNRTARGPTWANPMANGRDYVGPVWPRMALEDANHNSDLGYHQLSDADVRQDVLDCLTRSRKGHRSCLFLQSAMRRCVGRVSDRSTLRESPCWLRSIRPERSMPGKNCTRNVGPSFS